MSKFLECQNLSLLGREIIALKAYLCHFHPEVDALFQCPKDISLKFDPERRQRSTLRGRSWAITLGKYDAKFDRESLNLAVLQ